MVKEAKQNWPKSKLAEVEIGPSRNWPKLKLAEVEKKNWPKSKLAEVDHGRGGRGRAGIITELIPKKIPKL